MRYIIVDVSGGPEYAVVVTDEGENLIFYDKDFAEWFAKNELQFGVVVPVEINYD
jgi:hypothetical protein